MVQFLSELFLSSPLCLNLRDMQHPAIGTQLVLHMLNVSSMLVARFNTPLASKEAVSTARLRCSPHTFSQTAMLSTYILSAPFHRQAAVPGKDS